MTAVLLAVSLACALGALGLGVWRRHVTRARWRVLRPLHAGLRADQWFTPGRTSRLRGAFLAWPTGAAVAVLGGAGFGCGVLADGIVAGLALAAYAMTGTVLLRRHLVRRDQARARDEAAEAVGAFAADLRAGLPVSRALAEIEPTLQRAQLAGADAAVVAGRVRVAVVVAEWSGAPLADVLDRLDGHLAAVGRARAAASAQSAGAHASAVLLAAMPVAGLGLGGVIGVDPLRVLLRTPLGAGSLLLAIGLQLAGLAWSIRLARVEVAT